MQNEKKWDDCWYSEEIAVVEEGEHESKGIEVTDGRLCVLIGSEEAKTADLEGWYKTKTDNLSVLAGGDDDETDEDDGDEDD